MEKFLLVYEKSLFWLLVFLTVFIILWPKLPLFGVSGTFVAIRAEDLLIFVVLSVWALYQILSGGALRLIKDRLNQSLGLFFFIGALSLFSAVFLTSTVQPNLGLLHYLRRVELILLLPLAYTVVKTKKQVISLLLVLSAVLLIVNLYALGQQYLGWPVVSTTNSEFSKGLILRLEPWARVNSTFAGHYDLAVFLGMALVLLTALFFAVKKWFLRSWIVILASFSFVVLVMTAARVAFMATLVGVIASLLLTGKKTFVFLMIGIAAAAILYPSQLRDRLISTVTVNLLDRGVRYEDVDKGSEQDLNIPTLPRGQASPSAEVAEASQSATPSAKVASDIAPGEPIDTTQLGVYRSFEIRQNVEWPRAIRAFLKNPFLGTGYSSLGLATDNDLLRSMGEVGILGTAAFGLVLVALVKRVRAGFRSSSKFVKYICAGVISVILAFLLNGLFIDVFEASKIASLFWIVAGLGVAMEKIE